MSLALLLKFINNIKEIPTSKLINRIDLEKKINFDNRPHLSYSEPDKYDVEEFNINTKSKLTFISKPINKP